MDSLKITNPKDRHFYSGRGMSRLGTCSRNEKYTMKNGFLGLGWLQFGPRLALSAARWAVVLMGMTWSCRNAWGVF